MRRGHVRIENFVETRIGMRSKNPASAVFEDDQDNGVAL
jgi:hypothetical protein